MAKSPTAEKAKRTRRGRRAPRPRGRMRRPTPDALADLLNPAIDKGTAGMGSRHRACSRRRTIRSTAAPIFPPRTRRASRRAKGFDEAPQSDYTGVADHRARSGVGEGTGTRRATRSPPDPPAQSARGSRTHRARAAIRNTGCRRADLPQPGSGLASMGVAATAQALETIAARGPAGIRRSRPLDAAPAAAAGEIRRRQALRDRVRLRAEGRPAAGDHANWSKASSATTARRCCSASPAPARPSPWPR